MKEEKNTNRNEERFLYVGYKKYSFINRDINITKTAQSLSLAPLIVPEKKWAWLQINFQT